MEFLVATARESTCFMRLFLSASFNWHSSSGTRGPRPCRLEWVGYAHSRLATCQIIFRANSLPAMVWSVVQPIEGRERRFAQTGIYFVDYATSMAHQNNVSSESYVEMLALSPVSHIESLRDIPGQAGFRTFDEHIQRITCSLRSGASTTSRKAFTASSLPDRVIFGDQPSPSREALPAFSQMKLTKHFATWRRRWLVVLSVPTREVSRTKLGFPR